MFALRPQKMYGLLETGSPGTSTSTFTQLLSSAVSDDDDELMLNVLR